MIFNKNISNILIIPNSKFEIIIFYLSNNLLGYIYLESEYS